MLINMFEYIKQRYEKTKQLAEELWLHKDTTGNPNDYYYFECGFVNGLTYVEHELVQLKIAVRSLLDDVNKRYPDKNPREWTCKHMQLLDDLIQKDVLQEK